MQIHIFEVTSPCSCLCTFRYQFDFIISLIDMPQVYLKYLFIAITVMTAIKVTKATTPNTKPAINLLWSAVPNLEARVVGIRISFVNDDVVPEEDGAFDLDRRAAVVDGRKVVVSA